MPNKKIRCVVCNELFEPRPGEVNYFINHRLHRHFYAEALKSNLFKWQLGRTCPYCREAKYGKQKMVQKRYCPLCGNWTGRVFCPFCGRPLELISVSITKPPKKKNQRKVMRLCLGANYYGCIIKVR